VTVARVNGLDVFELTVTRARQGRAILDCTLSDTLQDTNLEFASAVSLDLAGIENVFAGEVVRLGRVGGTTRLRALEASDLDKPVTARFYRNVEANLIASDILREVGVKTSDLQLGAVFASYVRKASTGMGALNALCQHVGAGWRTRAGTTPGVLAYRLEPVVREPQPRANPLVWGDDLLAFDPELLEYTCLVRAGLVPGMVVNANAYGEVRDIVIDRVQHSVMGGVVRTCVWAER
jgi:hypothetical protein